ncbi:ABC transporter family protein [Trichomonas vaginalis G3]|uniref:ABC transporter family protein n=1 Tax=Trichomonas vaginalis (strain ATCC PRA-98 / G3) TaxID=412133 RepID=A2DKG0_TRIV3|nr:ABC transporter B family [Trichomonas vaginalis G3]EAY19137.1 ABC transporter family protein [Trichomonas vaginalis G3]KAI5490434.1 ABC transporter B family [Trichomonas vaginalis G3]|eukprot:XP_001580123.1 ABC transporter family protein [Trichomonas vaginalis G3]
MSSDKSSRVTSEENIEKTTTTGFEMFECLKLFRNKAILFLVYFISLGNGALPIFNMMILGDVTSSASTDPTKTATKLMTPLLLKLTYISIAQAVILLITIMCKSYIIPTFTVDIRQAMFNSIMTQPIDFFDKTSSGVLMGRFSEDITIIRDVYIEKNCAMLQGMTMSLIAIIMGFIRLPYVSLSYFVAIPLLVASYILSEKYIDKLWKNHNIQSTSIASKTEEVISQYRTVKAFDCEKKECDDYNDLLDNVDDIYRKTAIAQGLKEAFSSIIANGLTVFVVYFIAYLMMVKKNTKVKSGDSLSMMMYIMLGTMGFSQILSASDSYKKANMAALKILNIINRKVENDSENQTEIGKIEGKIEFQNVSFKYSTRDEYAIRNLTFEIKPGETVALVGESGCGKTTTLSLLQRFYDVSEGKILIDGKDISNFSASSLRSQISCVPQSPVLFSMSILDNVKYGKPESSFDEVKTAAEIGNAHNFICQMENQYDQEVQQISLSGGQKQRICISRAVLCNAPILLLDEATASLDAESEQLVQESLEKVRKGKTAIIVAHRLSTVKNADRILVFDNGTIVETGTHEELLEKGGIYSNLVKFQLQ